MLAVAPWNLSKDPPQFSEISCNPLLSAPRDWDYIGKTMEWVAIFMGKLWEFLAVEISVYANVDARLHSLS
jgi:hypothetical protein